MVEHSEILKERYAFSNVLGLYDIGMVWEGQVLGFTTIMINLESISGGLNNFSPPKELAHWR